MPAKRRTTRTGPTVRRRRHPRSPDKLLDVDCRLASEVIGLAGGEALTRTASVLSEELGCTVEAAFTSDHARLGADTADLASDIRSSVVHDCGGRSVGALRVVDPAPRFDDPVRGGLSSAADQVAGLLAHVRD